MLGLCAAACASVLLVAAAESHAAAGDPDPTFSGDGRQTTDFGRGGAGAPVAVAVVGTAHSGDVALARDQPDGSLDVSFDGDGKQTSDFGSHDQAVDVAIQADGKVVAAGFTPGGFALARYQGRSAPADPDPVSPGAYEILRARALANRQSFLVYADADSAFNHGFASGFFGNALGAISLDPACLDDPAASSGCSSDTDRLDRERGTVLSVGFGPLAPGQFAGLNVEEPENFAISRLGRGYDLRGATEVAFEVRSPTPGGVRVRFGVGERTTPFMTIAHSDSFRTMRFTLSSLGLTAAALADAHVLFTVGTNDVNAPQGGTLLLDDIRFEPVPTAHAGVLGLPLSTATFGVLPRATPAPGRVPFPADQVLRNLATTYESAIALDALLYRATPADIAPARAIADAFTYALAPEHDNAGDPIPAAPDGSRGLHNGYFAGDLALRNDQAGPARADQVRLPGFVTSQATCGPTRFCLLLDGATGGNNAFAALALLSAYRRLGDARYLAAARTIGRWIAAQLADSDASGFGGFFLGYPDHGAVPRRSTTASRPRTSRTSSRPTTRSRVSSATSATRRRPRSGTRSPRAPGTSSSRCSTRRAAASLPAPSPTALRPGLASPRTARYAAATA